MEHLLETIEGKHGIKAEIYPDNDPENPREAWDNFGNMICFHTRYKLGDKHELKSDSFNSWDEIKDYLVKENKAEIILPLYLYDHSGLRIKVGSFRGLLPQGHAEFDSGIVGFIYCTKDEARKNYPKNRYYLKEAENLLKSEVETYDQYLSGQVYGYIIKDKNDEELDSCWGFFGYDYIQKEAKELIKHYEKKAYEQIRAEKKEKYCTAHRIA
jgi:hypothetical protein